MSAKKPAARKTAAPKTTRTAKKATRKTVAKNKKKLAPATAPARGRGRPTLYSEQMAKAICGWKKQGYTIRQIEALPNMPTKTTIMRWLADHEGFCEQYVRAGEVAAIMMCDEVVDIVEDGSNDWMERELKGGGTEVVLNREAIERSRMRVDARFRLMEKMAPKRYGKRMALTGKDGGPIKTQSVASVLDEIDGAGTGLPGDDA